MNDFSDRDTYYELDIEIYPTGEKERSCYWFGDLGKSVCQSLAAQGWIAYDGNE